MVRAPGSVPQYSAYGPVDQGRPASTGLVAFLANGANFVVKARRENAEKQMYDACGGRYRIVAEGPQQSGGTVTRVLPGYYQYTPNTYWYIQFMCV